MKAAMDNPTVKTYYYNEYTGETDNSGRPIVTNKEDFDMEELSIKMFGLKKH